MTMYDVVLTISFDGLMYDNQSSSKCVKMKVCLIKFVIHLQHQTFDHNSN